MAKNAKITTKAKKEIGPNWFVKCTKLLADLTKRVRDQGKTIDTLQQEKADRTAEDAALEQKIIPIIEDAEKALEETKPKGTTK